MGFFESFYAVEKAYLVFKVRLRFKYKKSTYEVNQMKDYYINTNTDTNPYGNNEVHAEGCDWMPSISNREYLGYFNNGIEAVNSAKSKGYTKADGCKHCSPEAHK